MEYSGFFHGTYQYGPLPSYDGFIVVEHDHAGDMLLRRGFAWCDVRAAIAQISENATEFDYEE